MKIAALISGEPRFCEEFSLLLDRIKNFTTIDWYFFLWQKNYNLDPLHPNADLVAPSWVDYTYEWAENKIKSNLPKNHNIGKLVLADKDQYKVNCQLKNVGRNVKVVNVWLMYTGLKEVNKLRHASNINYDLVIRTRPDISLDKEIDMQYIKSIVKPKQLLLPQGYWFGYSHNINDQMAIGMPEDIDVYCSTVDSLDAIQQDGVTFHPETLLAYHLKKQGIEYIKGPYDAHIRVLGTLAPNYKSLFGRWQ